MQLPRKNFCPLIKAECMGLDCKFFIKIVGQDPQSDQIVEEWDCAISWLPMLLIENSKEVRQGAAATESFRNEMVRANETNVELQIRLAQQKSDPKLIEGD